MQVYKIQGPGTRIQGPADQKFANVRKKVGENRGPPTPPLDPPLPPLVGTQFPSQSLDGLIADRTYALLVHSFQVSR